MRRILLNTLAAPRSVIAAGLVIAAAWASPPSPLRALKAQRTTSEGRVEALREVAYQQLAALRKRFQLEPLRRDPRLERAAQKQVEDSVRHGYFNFVSPDGKGLDDWVSDEGYDVGQIAEKLAEANLRIDEIVKSWGSRPDDNLSSVLHAELQDVGIGVARLGDRNRVIAVVGITDDDLVRSRVLSLMDADRVEAEFSVHLNQLREQAGLKPMKPHPALRSAATQLAEEILIGKLDPDTRRRSYSMVYRVRRAGYRMREAVELQAVGPTSVAELVEAWFTNPDSQGLLLRRFFSEFGLAVAVGETDDGPTVAWVLSMGRPGRV